MLSVLLKLLIILVLTPRASTRLLAVKLGYLAVYSMNTSVRKLFRLPIFFVMIVPVGECLVEVLKEAARRYSQNGGCAGCMVLEGIHSHDPLARDIAVQYYHAAETTIYDYIARRHPQSAQCVTDFMSTVMSGLSAKAREGHSIEQLCATAALAGEAIKTLLKE
ncbi:TetR family transcriptional regulator [Escherichia coli]|uniref:TetR family transcriptional regulator n=1 Tax=Escherichia coli TaxID=562 RepID=A0A376TM29_ECOLX|nr:TetR family transcriptional regulator [Escherichia coli]